MSKTIEDKTLEKLNEYIESGAYKYSGPVIGKEEVKCCIEALEKQTWISVKDRLPPKPALKEKGYIVQVDNITEPFSAYWDGVKWTDDEDDYLYGVVAWQPLPEPYKVWWNR